MSIGSNIKKILKDKEISQKDFADMLNETTVNLNRYLNEQRNIPTSLYPLISKVLNMSIDEIIGNQSISTKVAPHVEKSSYTKPNDYDNMGFSYKKVKSILKAKNMTQKVFYEELKLIGYMLSFESLRSYLRGAENRDPSSSTIHMMSKVLQVNVSELFYSDNPTERVFKINKNIEFSLTLNREMASALNQKCKKFNISSQEYIKSLLVSNL